jgi:hypothetical protein
MKDVHDPRFYPYEMGRQVLKSLLHMTKDHPDHMHSPLSIIVDIYESSGTLIGSREVEYFLKPYVSRGLVTKSALGLNPSPYPGLEDISYAYLNPGAVTGYLANLKMEKKIMKAIGVV